MKKWLLACSAGVLLVSSLTAQADTQNTSVQPKAEIQASVQAPVIVSNARIRLMPEGASSSALYLTLKNTGKTPAELVGAEVFDVKDHKPLAKEVMLHQTTTKGNVKKMEHVPKVEVAPGKRTFLKPGGSHIMLIGLNHPLKQGEIYDIKLNFSDKSVIFSTAKVNKISFKKSPS